MKENINEHDKTKQMMDIIRNGFKTKLMTEAEEMQQQQTQSPAPNNVPLERGDDLPEPEVEIKDGDEEITPNDSVYKEELDKLVEMFQCKVEITDFNINRDSGRVVINGVFEKGDVIPNDQSNRDSGIYFKLDSKQFEEPETVGTVPLGDVVTKISNLFKNYYDNFRIEWLKKMTSEYPPLNK